MHSRGRSGVEQENGTGQPWNHALPIKLPVPRIPLLIVHINGATLHTPIARPQVDV